MLAHFAGLPTIGNHTLEMMQQPEAQDFQPEIFLLQDFLNKHSGFLI